MHYLPFWCGLVVELTTAVMELSIEDMDALCLSRPLPLSQICRALCVLSLLQNALHLQSVIK